MSSYRYSDNSLTPLLSQSIVGDVTTPVTWTNLINTTQVGTTLTKTGGTDNFDAGAQSVQSVSSGNFSIRCNVGDPNDNRILWFAVTQDDVPASDPNYVDTKWGWLTDFVGNASCFEAGNPVSLASTSISSGDDLSISCLPDLGEVRFYKNSTLIFTLTGQTIDFAQPYKAAGGLWLTSVSPPFSKIYDAEIITSAGGTAETDRIKVIDFQTYAFQAEWTGTISGTITVLGSLDGENFREFGVSVGTQPAGSAGGVLIPLYGHGMKWLKLRYVNTSGDGDLVVTSLGKTR